MLGVVGPAFSKIKKARNIFIKKKIFLAIS